MGVAVITLPKVYIQNQSKSQLTSYLNGTITQIKFGE